MTSGVVEDREAGLACWVGPEGQGWLVSRSLAGDTEQGFQVAPRPATHVLLLATCKRPAWALTPPARAASVALPGRAVPAARSSGRRLYPALRLCSLDTSSRVCIWVFCGLGAGRVASSQRADSPACVPVRVAKPGRVASCAPPGRVRVVGRPELLALSWWETTLSSAGDRFHPVSSV